VMATASTPAGSNPCAFNATRLVVPQSTSAVWPPEVTLMQV